MPFDPKAYLAGAEPARVPAKGGFNPKAYLAEPDAPIEESEESPGIITRAAEALDSVTGAPVRTAIMAKMDGGSALEAFAKSFAADPRGAPTGKQIAQRMGASAAPLVNYDDKTMQALRDAYEMDPSQENHQAMMMAEGLKGNSRSGALGLGIEVAADPTNLIPGVAVARRAAVASKGLNAMVEALKASKPVVSATDKAKSVGEVAKAAVGAVGSAGAKVAEITTGVPEQVTKHYWKNTERVDKLGKTFQGNTLEAGNAIREGYGKTIKAKTGELGRTLDEITEAGKGVPAEGGADVGAVVRRLRAAREGLDPVFDKDAIGKIDEHLRLIGEVATDEGRTTGYSAHRIKGHLQSAAKPSFDAGGNVVYQGGPRAANIAKGASGEARVAAEAAFPELYATTNKQSERLHRLEDFAHKGLFKTEKPEAGLLAAGSGANPRFERQLKLMGDVTGSDMLTPAQDLAAMGTFHRPQGMSLEKTGKAAARMAAGGAAGGLLGGLPGILAGALVSNPMALKATIKTLKASGRGATSAGRAAAAGVGSLAHADKQAIIKSLQQMGMEPKLAAAVAEDQELLQDLQDPKLKAALQEQLSRKPTAIQRRLSR